MDIPENANPDDVLYVAAYNERQELAGVYFVENIQNTNSFETPEGAAALKVFIWNRQMCPLVKTK